MTGNGDLHPAVAVAPAFAVIGAETVRAAVPTLRFRLEASLPEGPPVFMIALLCRIHVDPARRKYDPETRERLLDLFGEPRRWGGTARSFLWAERDVLVPPFRTRTEFDVLVPCTYDHEIAATRYFGTLPDGEIPLTFHFNGSVYHEGKDGRLQIVPVPWDRQAAYRLPVDVWREMMDRHYPNAAWIRLDRETLGRLRALRTTLGLPSLDACIATLLDGEAAEGTPAGDDAERGS